MFLNPYYFRDNPNLINCVNKLIADMKQAQKDITNVTEICNELKQFIEQMGEQISEEVKQKIDELYESGEIHRIVEELIEQDVSAIISEIETAPKNTIIDFARVGRKLYQTGENVASNSINPLEAYTYAQGCCTFLHNGVRHYAFCLRNSNNTSNNAVNNNVDLRVYNPDGTLIKNAILELNHANSITYNPQNNCFYVVENQYTVTAGNTTPTNDISVVDFETLEIVNKITCNIPSYWNTLNGISYHNDKLYISGSVSNNRFGVAEWNRTTNRVSNEILVQYPADVSIPTMQEMAVNNKFFFFLTYNENAIIRISREKQAIDHIYKIPMVLNNGWFLTGEVEAFDVDDNGDCYLFTTMHTVRRKSLNAYDMVQIFKQNLYTNNVICKNITITGSSKDTENKIGYGSDELTITVDRNKNVFNPTGSMLNPFYVVQEAVLLATSCLNKFKWNIRLINGNNSSLIYIPHGDICLRGPTSATEDSSYDTSNPIFRQVGQIICYGGNISIDHLRIGTSSGAFQATSDGSNLGKFAVVLKDGSFSIAECDLYVSSFAPSTDHKGIHVHRAVLSMGGNSAITESEWYAKGGIEFITSTNSTVNTNGKMDVTELPHGNIIH